MIVSVFGVCLLDSWDLRCGYVEMGCVGLGLRL